jgi:hypothetical protein
MPHPLAPVATCLVKVATVTTLSEGLKSPKAIALFYGNLAKSCYEATGSKRIVCAVAGRACGLVIVIVPGPHQAPFIAVCTASLKGANKL